MFKIFQDEKNVQSYVENRFVFVRCIKNKNNQVLTLKSRVRMWDANADPGV
jgi:hypothetical protein